MSGPGIAIGLDTQGFGNYNPEDLLGGDTLKFDRYDIKAFGAFVSVSKNWMTFLGNLGLHGGMNYNFTITFSRHLGVLKTCANKICGRVPVSIW